MPDDDPIHALVLVDADGQPLSQLDDETIRAIELEGGLGVERLWIRPADAAADESNRSKLLEAIDEADVVILLRKKGQAGVAFFKGLGTVPLDMTTSYGEKDDPPLTIRHVNVKAGFTAKEWKALDRSPLHSEHGARAVIDG